MKKCKDDTENQKKNWKKPLQVVSFCLINEITWHFGVTMKGKKEKKQWNKMSGFHEETEKTVKR